MTERRHYKPGDTFIWDEQYEVVAKTDRGNKHGCDDCIGRLHLTICDALPGGCNEDQIVWLANNEAACLLAVITKLEGNTVDD